MPPAAPEPLTPEALEAVLVQAKAERWTELALRGPGYEPWRETLILRGWPAARAFVLCRSLDRVPPALVTIESLTSLALGGNRIGAAEAAALSCLTSLTLLNLLDNQLGPAGAVAIARVSGLTSLSFEDHIGDAGAVALARLTGLTSLNLGYNQIGDAGAEALTSLTFLTSLDLPGNQIGDAGAEAMARLTGLASLNLANNRIGDAGAEALASLTGLTSLDLSDNRIGDAGAEALTSLTGLTELTLFSNPIGDAGGRALAGLSGLSSLKLRNTLIGEAGARVILDAWAHPATAKRRRILELSATDRLSRLLPEEVLTGNDAQALIAAWRRFREAEATGEKRPLNEAKVLVVGEGNAGKTSLIRYLTTGEPRNPAEPATEGVRAYEQIATERWRAEGSPFTLNIWDFGGQEIYYGTHRYFLTARSLYLLVLDDRTDGPADAEKWLQRIRSHAAGAPIIVVVNKAGEGGPGLRLAETELMARYAPIVAFHRTSCDPGNDEKIDALKVLILSTIGDTGLMPDVQRGYPEPWWRIKDALAERARAQHYVHDHEFRSLCEQHGMVDDSDQRAILATLHNLGTVVARGLDPEARSVHRETTLLDPNWLTQAIYAILGSARVRDQNGEFALVDLATILDPEVHPPRFHEQIVTLMQDARLGLCLRLQGQGERYLLPAALPPSVPEALTAGAFRPCRRYRYASLPGDLLPRFMVQMRELIGEGSARWRDGVVLTLHGCHVLVRVTPADRRLDVGVDASGQHADPRRAIEAIENEFDKLHREFGAIGAKGMVPLPDRAEEEVDLAVLQRLARERTLSYRHESADGPRDYSVRELLSGVRETDESIETSSSAARVLTWLQTWPGTAAALAALMMLVVPILLPLPWSEWDQKLAWGAVFAGVTYFVVQRSDPALIYRRLVWITVPVCLSMLLLGASLQFGAWGSDAFIEAQIGVGSVWAAAVAFVIVTALLIVADLHLTRLRSVDFKSSTSSPIK